MIEYLNTIEDSEFEFIYVTVTRDNITIMIHDVLQ